MRHPEKGEALKATTVMEARLNLVDAGDADGVADVGDVYIDRTGRAEGEDMAAYYRCYSDLFDMGETVIAALPAVRAFGAALDRGEHAESVLLSLYLQAKGVGAMEERARWTR